MREEVVAHLGGMSREDAEALDRAAQAMWKADGGDERMGWERLDTRSRMRWHRLAFAAWKAFATSAIPETSVGANPRRGARWWEDYGARQAASQKPAHRPDRLRCSARHHASASTLHSRVPASGDLGGCFVDAIIERPHGAIVDANMCSVKCGPGQPGSALSTLPWAT
jgi:hypothetical protein